MRSTGADAKPGGSATREVANMKHRTKVKNEFTVNSDTSGGQVRELVDIYGEVSCDNC